ncbi:hypothetical protein BYT27DRAFT_7270686 [Phlegmacium glaucopus]|nr:hypothetical protein BYT27DRAFT_7270686 [Phlegmacium glaucopus]
MLLPAPPQLEVAAEPAGQAEAPQPSVELGSVQAAGPAPIQVVNHEPAVEMPTPSMPPPSTPAVTLQPPTPQTSQEAAASGLTTLLEVPVVHPRRSPEAPNTWSQSQSNSPAPPPSTLRRSPRSRSPAPVSGSSSKRLADPPVDEPAAKKRRED